MKSYIVFDFDGVVFDSFRAVFEVLRSMHSKYGLSELREENFKDLFLGNVWETYEKTGVGSDRIEAFKSDFRELFKKKQQQIQLFDGMRECLQAFSNIFGMIIVSSNHAEAIREMLEQEGLLGYFSSILGSEAGDSKREKITAFLAAHQSPDMQAFFVSDTSGDILDVAGLGIFSIAVSWGYHSAESLSASKPDKIVSSPRELQSFLLSKAM